jgi:hypothetical protein
LAQQLSIQVNNMSAAGVSGELVKSVKYLQTHVVRIMRAQELVKGQIEPPAGNLEHKDTIEKAAEQQKQLAESKLVTDELSKFAAISSSSATTKRMGDGEIEGDKTLSRMEAKLDAIMTKLDNRDGNSELEEAAVDKAPQTNAKENDNGDSPAIQNVSQQPAAMQATPLNVKDQTNLNSTGLTAAPSPNSALAGTHLVAPASPNVTDRPPKRRREDESKAFSPARSVPLSEAQRKNLAALAKLRSIPDSILDKLVPCPDGGLWDPSCIYERFHDLFTIYSAQTYATRLAKFMDLQDLQTWCCVRCAAAYGVPTVYRSSKCNICGIYCVQIRRVAADEGPASRYYYVRVVKRDSAVH